jgi:hypothetical protein
MKKTTIIGNSTTIRGRFFRPPPPNMFQFQTPPDCASTIVERFIDPANRITVRITRPMETS